MASRYRLCSNKGVCGLYNKPCVFNSLNGEEFLKEELKDICPYVSDSTNSGVFRAACTHRFFSFSGFSFECNHCGKKFENASVLNANNGTCPNCGNRNCPAPQTALSNLIQDGDIVVLADGKMFRYFRTALIGESEGVNDIISTLEIVYKDGKYVSSDDTYEIMSIYRPVCYAGYKDTNLAHFSKIF